MIAFVEKPPRIEPHGDSFLVTFKSGDSETAFMLTLHAMSALCGIGMGKVKQAQAAQFEPTPFPKKGRR
jgi:hypothetical protein